MLIVFNLGVKAFLLNALLNDNFPDSLTGSNLSVTVILGALVRQELLKRSCVPHEICSSTGLDGDVLVLGGQGALALIRVIGVNSCQRI